VSASGAEIYEDVAAGRIDTVLCAEEAPPSLESEMLFTLDFVCLVGAALRVRARRLTLKQYLEFQHVLVEIREGQQPLLDRTLSQLGAKRQVALTLPFYVPAIFAIAQTDLVLTVPRRLAKITAVMAGVRVVEAPREIKPFPYFMAWHPRLTGEPAHKWFREQLRSAVKPI
jgi:DNA-binding transcriptional LysR family regulator